MLKQKFIIKYIGSINLKKSLNYSDLPSCVKEAHCNWLFTNGNSDCIIVENCWLIVPRKF